MLAQHELPCIGCASDSAKSIARKSPKPFPPTLIWMSNYAISLQPLPADEKICLCRVTILLKTVSNRHEHVINLSTMRCSAHRKLARWTLPTLPDGAQSVYRDSPYRRSLQHNSTTDSGRTRSA